MRVLALAIIVGALCGCVFSQTTSTNGTFVGPGDADVYLNVPQLEVQLIQLIVEKLNVSLNLDLKVGNLVSLTAGVSAYIEGVNLTISGVSAQAELIVRLDNVAAIVENTLDTIDKNPQIITGLLSAVGNLLGSVAGILNSTLNALGQVVQTVVDTAGNIISQTLDTAGKVVSQTLTGNVNALQLLSSVTNSLGQFVTQVVATDGSILNITYDRQGGTILGVQVVSGPNTTTTSTTSSSTTSS